VVSVSSFLTLKLLPLQVPGPSYLGDFANPFRLTTAQNPAGSSYDEFDNGNLNHQARGGGPSRNIDPTLDVALPTLPGDALNLEPGIEMQDADLTDFLWKDVWSFSGDYPMNGDWEDNIASMPL
jgi:hypothetical protein